MNTPVLVVGDGPAARRLTWALADRGHRGPVVVVAPGDGPAPEADRYPDRVEILDAAGAVRLDRPRRLVRTARHGDLPYGELVLATGVRPVRASCAAHGGETDPGCRVQAGRHLPRLAPGPVVVVGGGPRGVEAALELARAGREVTLAHRGPVPMHRRLDEVAGRMLADTLAEAGVTLRLGRTVTERVPGKVLLDDGEVVPAEALLVRAGSRPDTRVAAAAGLAVRHGVLVDSRLRTVDPAVSALGGCAELPAPAPDPYPVAWDAADALAARLTGGPVLLAPPHVLRLRGPGLETAVAGSLAALEAATEQITLYDPAGRRYARIGLEAGRVSAAVVTGLPAAAAEVARLYERGLPVPAARLALLLGVPARTGSTRPLPDDTVVCRCNDVTRGRLADAWRGGARTVAALAAATRATTGCGGCSDDLRRLCTAMDARESGTGEVA
ncbi:FAD-dependent oxidoreductase [Streptomyces sp. NPDC058676]|uniref:FAD-dependent oxidoreductase n=1 Tax=unclassified Streptomyces TaxID=2593676 RepID=UPI00364B7DF9